MRLMETLWKYDARQMRDVARECGKNAEKSRDLHNFFGPGPV